MEARTERVEIPSAAGQRLAAEMDWPAGRAPVPAVAFSHGWGSGKASPRNRQIARHLVKAGIAALRLDFTGHGESTGTEEDSTLGQQTADLTAALSYLRQRPEVSAVGVAGSSSGGLPALRLAAEDPRLGALVLREPRSEGMLEAAGRIQAPTMLISGGAASPLLEPIRRLADVLECPHRLVIIEGGGHLFEAPAAFEAVTHVTVSWFRLHLLGAQVGA